MSNVSQQFSFSPFSLAAATMESNEEDNCYGPALPPHLLKPAAPSEPAVIGPALPPNFKPTEAAVAAASSAPQYKYTSDSESDSDDEDHVGPLPMDSDRVTKAQLELEERALEYQIMGVPSASTSKREGGREEWMIELPEVKKVTDLGLGARQFRSSEGPDFSDRTSWTDTPNTVKKAPVAQAEDITGRLASIQERERDKAMDKMKRKHEKKHKRDKSLLELHEKKLKKKKVNRIVGSKRRISGWEFNWF